MTANQSIVLVIGLCASIAFWLFLAPEVLTPGRGHQPASTEDEARRQLEELEVAIATYRLFQKRNPASMEELVEAARSGEPYMPVTPTDPWGRPYTYELGEPRAFPRLSSLGRDGQAGTADDIVLPE